MLLRCPDGREVRIIRDIAAENNNLGLALRFGAPVLAAIQQGANFQPEPACREILRRWLQGSGRQPVTWKTLIKALNEVYPELGKDLSAAFKTASPSENKNGELIQNYRICRPFSQMHNMYRCFRNVLSEACINLHLDT